MAWVLWWLAKSVGLDSPKGCGLDSPTGLKVLGWIAPRVLG